MTRRAETGVIIMTTGKVLMGTRLAASLHQRSMAEDATEATVTYVMSSTVEMHVAKLKAGTKIESVKSKNDMIKETMITTVLTMTNLTRSSHRKWETSQEVSKCTPET
jgi:hypothetical protein